MTEGKPKRVKVCIYFRIRDMQVIRAIKRHFGIKEGITVNGECYTSIKQSDWETFKETERRGFFSIRNKNQQK